MITKEITDLLAPTHDRTSCDDSDINNGYIYSENGIIKNYPRCLRCYLLNTIGFEIDSRLKLHTSLMPSEEYSKALDDAKKPLDKYRQLS